MISGIYTSINYFTLACLKDSSLIKKKPMITKAQIEKAVKDKKYAWFEGTKDYDVNIVGVRNSVPGTKVTNVFDDLLTISCKINGKWAFYSWAITTDPGRRAMQECTNPKGVAILVPGQYRSSHVIGLHQGKYPALKQQKNVKVFRDKNKNQVFDMDPATIQEGIFGINIHRSNPTTQSEVVENWSEGCQVFKRVMDFNEFMAICNKAKEIHGNSFSYTLLTSGDIY